MASWYSVKLEYLFSVTSVCLISTFKGSMQNKMCVSARVSISECVSSISKTFGNIWRTFFTILCKKMELQEEFVFISRSHLIISDRFNVDRSDSWLIVQVVWILWLLNINMMFWLLSSVTGNWNTDRCFSRSSDVLSTERRSDKWKQSTDYETMKREIINLCRSDVVTIFWLHSVSFVACLVSL